MKNLLAPLLWLWMCLVVVGAFFYAPPAAGFIGYSSRILFFHVPLAWTAFVAFLVAAVWSGLYLARREPRHDLAAAAAVELGFVFCLLATITGSMWARTMWREFWNWDPRQGAIIAVLLFYGAYLGLRAAVADRETRARLTAVYALLGVVVTPYFFWVVPRVFYSLHPDSVVNTRGSVDMESRMLQVLLASWVGFNALFFWLHDLYRRAAVLREAREA